MREKDLRRKIYDLRISKENVPQLLLVFVSGVLLLIFLWWHWKLGMVRYFDTDEFAHLHWAGQIAMGKIPYIDFMFYIPPIFPWILTPVVLASWGTAAVFISARTLSFVIFFLMCLVTSGIFWQYRKSVWAAVLAAALLAFLPLPFDKYLEIRPDNLATLLLLVGVFFQLKVMEKSSNKHILLSGFFYGLSLLTLPKMLPSIIIASVMMLFSQLDKSGLWGKSIKEILNAGNISKLWLSLRLFIISFLLPFILFGIWAITLGDFSLVWYSITKLPFEFSKISQYFIMMPTLFFYPNTIFYGQEGWTRALMVNHVIWVTSIAVATIRLFTPHLVREARQVWQELLIAGMFISQIIYYVQFAPLRHAQYLIPIGVFVGIFTADGLLYVWERIDQRKTLQIVFTALFILSGMYLYQMFLEVNKPKVKWSNTEVLAKIQHLYNVVPGNEPVLDLDGGMLFNPDGYYVCCNPIGQFAGFMSRPLPNLTQTLINNNVKFINQGGLMRVSTLDAADQQYIYENYHSLNGDNTFLIRNDIPNLP